MVNDGQFDIIGSLPILFRSAGFAIPHAGLTLQNHYDPASELVHHAKKDTAKEAGVHASPCRFRLDVLCQDPSTNLLYVRDAPEFYEITGMPLQDDKGSVHPCSSKVIPKCHATTHTHIIRSFTTSEYFRH